MTRTYDGTSSVEIAELKRSGWESRYAPTEKIRIIEVDNFPLLGKLTAFRFVEWVQKNPGGVISLPTGKTPEHFIKWVKRILERWDTKEVQSVLADYGIDGVRRPDMKSLTFVQIDEFYPMDSQQHNSFNHYVREYYIKGFGLSPKKALLIDSTSLGLPPGKTMKEVFPDGVVDLSLRVRQTRYRAGSDSARCAQSSRLVLHGVRTKNTRIGRNRILPRGHWAGRSHCIQRPWLEHVFSDPTDGYQLRNTGGRGIGPRRH